MADYCTLDEVRGWLPSKHKIDDKSDPPRDDTVEDWITKFSGEIDSNFTLAGVAVPVTDDNLLKKLNIRLARELAYQVMAVRAAAKSEQVEPLYFGWHKEYEAMLTDIKDGELSPATAAANLGFSYLQGSVAGVVSTDPSIDPKIDVDARY